MRKPFDNIVASAALLGLTFMSAAQAQQAPPVITNTSQSSISATSTATVTQSGQPPVTQTDTCQATASSTDASGTPQMLTCETSVSIQTTDTEAEFADLTAEDWSLMWLALTGQP